MLNSVDLFSGIGGFAMALKGMFQPLLYCDKSPIVRSMLENLMANGKLHKAPIVDDVKNLSEILKAVGTRRVDMITSGWPCLGFASTGKRDGFKNIQSKDRKSTRLNSSHDLASRMPSSA